MLTFSEVLKKITAGETLNEQEIAVAKENESQLTDDQKKSLGFKVEAGEAPKDDNISNKQGQVTISASELAELRAGAEAGRKALEAREQESFKSEISSLKFSDKGGSLPLGMVDEFVSFGMKLSPALRVEFSELLKKMPETKLFGEIGSDGEQSVSNSADNRMALRNEIASYAKEHNMKFGEALRTLQSQDPDKFAQYKKSFTE